ncbi:MAG: biotin/lipoyl-containing protein, partial [Myxococcota bacterium]
EHPVTELVTSQDLVVWQLEVAAGKPLPLAQDEVGWAGHAIEARLYAEDPQQGFRPQTGRVRHFRPDRPTAWPGVRIDAGVRQGDVVTPFYDPMIAKVMAWGRDREEARRRLRRALQDLPVVGLTTNQGFLVELLGDASFVDAAITTGTLDDWIEAGHPLLAPRRVDPEVWAIAAAWSAEGDEDWFRSAHGVALDVTLQSGEETRTLSLVRQSDGAMAVQIADATYRIRFAAVPDDLDDEEDRRLVTIQTPDGPEVRRPVAGWPLDDGWLLDLGRGPVSFREPSPYPDTRADDDPREVRAPVAGTLVRLEVAVGDAIAADQTLGVVEAMKMETRLVARAAGTVTAVNATVGQQVRDGDVIVALDPEEA